MVDNLANSGSWRLLDHSFGSVYENLALEESFARNAVSRDFESLVRFWVNPPSVVVGRFQEVSSEVDVEQCEQTGIPIARRFTGGGAVYHDEGNLNFSIITRREERGSLTRLHSTASRIVLNAILGLGLKGIFLPPNSILLGERKVAGAAAAFGRDFALWHASILVSTNIEFLERILAPSKKLEANQFVRSRWIPVTTLQTAARDIELDDLEFQLIRSVRETLGVRLEAGQATSDELRLSEDLYRWKYSLQSWNRRGEVDERNLLRQLLPYEFAQRPSRIESS